MVLIWVARLMSTMDDLSAAGVLDHIGTATRVTWLVSVVALVVVLALEAIDHSGGN